MDVVKIAHLAKLSFTAEEQAKMADELNGIFHWIDALQAIKGEEEERPSQPVMVERVDVAQNLASSEMLLVNAPQQSYGMFSVPKVVETV